MFLKPAEWVNKSKPLKTFLVGTVVDNIDPLKLRRVRVTIPGVLEGSTNDLPWISPHPSIFLGGASNTTSFSIPEVGSKLMIDFPTEEVYIGFYFSDVYDQTTKTTPFDAEYPHAYGFLDSKNNLFKINKSTGRVDFFHFTGTRITIFPDGTVETQTVKDFNVIAANNINLTAQADNITITAQSKDINVDAAVNLNIEAGAKTTLTSPILEINSSTRVAINTPILTASGDAHLTGSLVADGDISDHTNESMLQMRIDYNSHSHNDPQGGQVSTPTVIM